MINKPAWKHRPPNKIIMEPESEHVFKIYKVRNKWRVYRDDKWGTRMGIAVFNRCPETYEDMELLFTYED